MADSRGAGRVHGKHSYSLDPPRLAVERYAQKFGPGSGDVEPGLDASLYQYSPVEMRHGGQIAEFDQGRIDVQQRDKAMADLIWLCHPRYLQHQQRMRRLFP